MCSDTKKSESIGDTHKIRTPIQESGDGQVISYYTMKEKTLRINNINKLSLPQNYQITPQWVIHLTLPSQIKYYIYLQNIGTNPIQELQINVSTKIELIQPKNYGVRLEWKKFTNHTSLLGEGTLQVHLDEMESVEIFKEFLKNILIPIVERS